MQRPAADPEHQAQQPHSLSEQPHDRPDRLQYVDRRRLRRPAVLQHETGVECERRRNRERQADGNRGRHARYPRSAQRKP